MTFKVLQIVYLAFIFSSVGNSQMNTGFNSERGKSQLLINYEFHQDVNSDFSQSLSYNTIGLKKEPDQEQPPKFKLEYIWPSILLGMVIGGVSGALSSSGQQHSGLEALYGIYTGFQIGLFTGLIIDAGVYSARRKKYKEKSSQEF